MESQDLKTFEILLSHKAKINHQGGTYHGVLQAAVFCRNLEVAAILLNQGAGFNKEVFLQAVEDKRVGTDHELLRQGADVGPHKGSKGNALCQAIDSKKKALIWAIMERNPDVNAHGKHGPALSAVIDAELEDVAVELLKRGANVNAQGDYHDSLLQTGVANGMESLVNHILDLGAGINISGGWYGSPLIAAASRGHLSVLLERGAEIESPGNNEGSALQVATSKGNQEMVQLLIDNGSNVNGPSRA